MNGRDSTHALARLLTPRTPPSQPLTWGVVQSVVTGTPPKVSVTIGGSTGTALARYAGWYNPVVGDVVCLVRDGKNFYCLGTRLEAPGGQLAPQGYLGYVALNTLNPSSGTISAETVMHTLTVTVGAGRRVKVEYYIPAVGPSNNGNIAYLAVRYASGGTVTTSSTRRTQSAFATNTTTDTFGAWVAADFAPGELTAGQWTFGATLALAAGTGGVTEACSSTVYGFFRVEDAGAV